MSSEDTFHSDHPEANQWMVPTHEGLASTSSVQAKHRGILPADRQHGTARTAMSGLIQRLARSLGVSSESLADSIDPDTIRRTKYPVRERIMEDGTTVFEHPEGIVEGLVSDIHK